MPEDRNRALIDFLCTRAKRAYQPLIEALYLTGKFCFHTFSHRRTFILGNDHLVALLDGSFLLSNARQQLDSAYRLPTSFEDIPLRSMTNNLEYEDNRFSVVDIRDLETTKYDEEVPMGFSIQLLTNEVLEQYPRLDPRTRSLKVLNKQFLLPQKKNLLVLSNVKSTTRSLFIN